MLVFGLLVPIHLRAVDESVLSRAGRTTPTLVERGLSLADQGNIGAARVILRTATDLKLVGRDKLAGEVSTLARTQVGGVLGGEEPLLQQLFYPTTATNAEPFTELVIRQEHRGPVIEHLRASKRPVVRQLVRCRNITNTAFFPPASSTSGQAFDAALSVAGLLLEQGKLAPGLSNALWYAAAQANGDVPPPAPEPGATTPKPASQPLEELLVDLMSLGQRLNWGQLEVFIGQVPDAATLRALAALTRSTANRLPTLFSAVALSGRPAEITGYMEKFSKDGLGDIEASLRSGAGGVKELLLRGQRWYRSPFRQLLAGYPVLDSFQVFAADYSWLMPGLALGAKWVFYLAAGFFLALAVHLGAPPASLLEEPLQVRGLHLARELLFGLGLLVVLVMFTEPFLTEAPQKVDFHFRLRLPIVSGAAPAVLANAQSSHMNPNSSLLTLLLFFVIQGLIYTACLLKLAEIRRHGVPARTKLKLLDNEDHLFDAGLYVGFAGTIISLILISQGVIKQPSLMAAYSSTSFGIIFCVVFKIFNLRPLRRQYLLEVEAYGPSAGHAADAPAARS